MVSLKLTISGILAILVGLMVLFFPKTIRIALGLYLVIVGILNLVNI